MAYGVDEEKEKSVYRDARIFKHTGFYAMIAIRSSSTSDISIYKNVGVILLTFFFQILTNVGVHHPRHAKVRKSASILGEVSSASVMVHDTGRNANIVS